MPRGLDMHRALYTSPETASIQADSRMTLEQGLNAPKSKLRLMGPEECLARRMKSRHASN